MGVSQNQHAAMFKSAIRALACETLFFYAWAKNYDPKVRTYAVE